MAVSNMWPCSAQDAFVIINEYHCGILDGYLVHPRLDSPQLIQSTSQLIRLLDQAQKLENVPYHPLSLGGVGFDTSKKLASFTISIFFQQHHTFQGRLVWHEASMEAVFRSALELIYLLDDILAGHPDDLKKNHD